MIGWWFVCFWWNRFYRWWRNLIGCFFGQCSWNRFCLVCGIQSWCRFHETTLRKVPGRFIWVFHVCACFIHFLSYYCFRQQGERRQNPGLAGVSKVSLGNRWRLTLIGFPCVVVCLMCFVCFFVNSNCLVGCTACISAWWHGWFPHVCSRCVFPVPRLRVRAKVSVKYFFLSCVPWVWFRSGVICAVRLWGEAHFVCLISDWLSGLWFV
jgi:hypothetical protein